VALSACVELAAEVDEGHLRKLEQLFAARLQTRSGGTP